MNAQLFGALSGGFTALAGVYYLVNTWRGTSRPNITSWTLWTFIGLAILLTYQSSGAKANLWPAVFGFVDPLLILGLAVYKRGKWEPLTKWERRCVICCISALILWYELQSSPALVQYALYVSIVADFCAALPTMQSYWRKPEEDRPFPWALFAFGYGLAIFAVTEPTFANYSLPIYMVCGSGFVTYLLARHRLRMRVPISEWV